MKTYSSLSQCIANLLSGETPGIRVTSIPPEEIEAAVELIRDGDAVLLLTDQGLRLAAKPLSEVN